MRRALVLTLLLVSGCVPGPATFGPTPGGSNAEAAADSLYWSAVRNLDPSNKNGTLDAGLSKLDAYLSSSGPLKHAAEATTLRSLARNSQQLARMEAALQQARANTAQKSESDSEEIQRLKEELAKANAELERIKKRLASPDKP